MKKLLREWGVFCFIFFVVNNQCTFKKKKSLMEKYNYIFFIIVLFNLVHAKIVDIDPSDINFIHSDNSDTSDIQYIHDVDIDKNDTEFIYPVDSDTNGTRRIHVVDINTKNTKLIRSIVMRFCVISFVKVRGDEYIVKQKRFLYKLLGPAKDALTAHIAESLYPDITDDYIAHRVDIIPAGKEIVGKPYPEWPATIHTIAPGKVMRELKGKCPYDVNLKQGQIGITRSMISDIAGHWQLAIILALDTFVCNQDRHKGNLFYLKSDNSFCAIDMDSSYKYNLAQLSYENFKQMLKKPTFNSKEIKALNQYNETLHYLLDTFSAKDILDLYDFYLEEAGFVNKSKFYTDKLKKIVNSNKKVIKESYPYVKKIVALLDDFLAHVK